MKFNLIVLPLTLLLLGACAPEQEESTDSGGPPRIEFNGKVDPLLSGIWKTETGNSELGLKGDGALTIQSKFNTPNGQQTSNRVGNWLVDEEKLKMRYAESDGSSTTIAYTWKISGDTLTLSTKSPAKTTIYKKQKP